VAAPLFIGEQVRVEGVRKGSDIVPQVFLQLPLGGLHLPDEFIGRHRMPHPVVNRVGTDLVTSAVGFDDLIPRSVGREVFPGWQNATLAFSAFDELENRLCSLKAFMIAAHPEGGDEEDAPSREFFEDRAGRREVVGKSVVERYDDRGLVGTGEFAIRQLIECQESCADTCQNLQVLAEHLGWRYRETSGFHPRRVIVPSDSVVQQNRDATGEGIVQCGGHPAHMVLFEETALREKLIRAEAVVGTVHVAGSFEEEPSMFLLRVAHNLSLTQLTQTESGVKVDDGDLIPDSPVEIRFTQEVRAVDDEAVGLKIAEELRCFGSVDVVDMLSRQLGGQFRDIVREQRVEERLRLLFKLAAGAASFEVLGQTNGVSVPFDAGLDPLAKAWTRRTHRQPADE
ncbi:unnamed protein product, partial [Durusdinium trenchii]